MVKLFTCRSGELLHRNGDTFFIWNESNECYQRGQREVLVDEQYLRQSDNDEWEVMDPSKATIV